MAEKPKLEIDSSDDLSALDERLLALYDTDANPISEAEEHELHPILNQLADPTERYEELELIAEGGEKRVTRVFDRRLNREVAMARAIRAKTQNDQENFLREAHLVANLVHPNILHIHNIGIDPNGIPFFTMELVRGDTLQRILQQLCAGDETYRREYPLDRLLGIFQKVGDAIAYAHSRNVLHLDIKPSNIHVGLFGEVFVCDWGLSRIFYDDDSPPPDTPGELDGDILNDMTHIGTIKGSPGFMAPEQTRADGEKNARTDIYALGVLLYMLLTHKLPFEGVSSNELVQNTREGKIIPPHRRTPERRIPKSLAAVALKALSFEPEKRYACVVELQQEVGRYLAGYPTHAERAGWIKRLSLLMKRHNKITSLLVFFLLIAGGLIGTSYGLLSRKQQEVVAKQKQAVANLQQAHRNFELYRLKHEEVLRLNDDLLKAIVSASKNPATLRPDMALKVLKMGLTMDLNQDQYEELMASKGILHFIRTEFATAHRCFKEAGPEKTQYITVLRDLSRDYAKIYPKGPARFSHEQLAELFDAAGQKNRRTNVILYSMYRHHLKKHGVDDPEAFLPLARAMLDHLNRITTPSPPLKLIRTKEGLHLDLSHTPYRQFTLKTETLHLANILEPLNLYSLDLRHTPLVQARELNGIKLHELYISGENLSRTGLIAALNQLEVKKLYIEKISAYRKILHLLHENYEIVELP